MGAALDRIKRIRAARQTVESLVQQPDGLLIIHYSCESFEDRPDGRTPRITSIAIRDFASGQTYSFSIHKIAELRNVSPHDIPRSYRELEQEMLAEYFKFVAEHRTLRWVHWNMRDVNYGFAAIEHRYRVLGGEPILIEDHRKFDLSRLFLARYGDNYIEHPRLPSLVRKNKITDLGFLSGAQEAAAFEAGNFVALHQSTLRKVAVLAHLLEISAAGSLQTNSNWWQTYGVSPQAIGELLREHWLFALFAFLAGVASVAGLYLALWPRK